MVADSITHFIQGLIQDFRTRGGGGANSMSFTALRLTARIQGPLTGPGSSRVAYPCDTMKPRRSKVKIPEISMNVYFSQLKEYASRLNFYCT